MYTPGVYIGLLLDFYFATNSYILGSKFIEEEF